MNQIFANDNWGQWGKVSQDTITSTVHPLALASVSISPCLPAWCAVTAEVKLPIETKELALMFGLLSPLAQTTCVCGTCIERCKLKRA